MGRFKDTEDFGAKGQYMGFAGEVNGM